MGPTPPSRAERVTVTGKVAGTGQDGSVTRTFGKLIPPLGNDPAAAAVLGGLSGHPAPDGGIGG